MKVSRKSWHYRVTNRVWSETDIPYTGRNLCRYFWMVVASVTGILSVVFLVALMIFMVAMECIASPYLALANAIMILYLVLLILTPIFSVYFFREKVGKYTEIPTPNILIEYISAKKNKYCPMIDFE